MAPVIFILVVLAITAFGFTLGLIHRLSGWNRSYERLAKRYTGKNGKGGVVFAFLFNKPILRFDYGRTFCILRNRKSLPTRSPNPTSRKLTELSMIWPDRNIRLEISTFPTKSRWFPKNLSPVEFTEGIFEAEEYQVSSNDPDAARELLSRNVQWQIEQLRRHGASRDVSISIYKGNLVVSKPGYIKAYQALDDFVRYSLELFDQLMLVDAEGLDFVNEGMATVVGDVKCPICSEEITQDLVVCTRCKTPHCRDCWHYNGQCATFACNETRFLSIGSATTDRSS